MSGGFIQAVRRALGALVSLLSLSAGPAAAETFVLVHGAFQNGAAWEQVRERLERSGHSVEVVSLPGRAGESAQAQTLDGYRDAVLAVVRAQSEPVILVGHSFGGITISSVAEAAPERVRLLVYVAAYLPQSGQSLQSLAAEDRGNKFTQENFVVAPDYSTASVLARDAALIFANDARGALRDRIASALAPEPLAPMATPVIVRAERFGRVPRVYIHTLRDNAVSHSLQLLMVERSPVFASYQLNSGHTPQLTRTRQLTGLLIRAARERGTHE